LGVTEGGQESPSGGKRKEKKNDTADQGGCRRRIEKKNNKGEEKRKGKGSVQGFSSYGIFLGEGRDGTYQERDLQNVQVVRESG